MMFMALSKRRCTHEDKCLLYAKALYQIPVSGFLYTQSERLRVSLTVDVLGKPSRGKSEVFLNIVQTGGEGGQPMFKNYVGNCRVFWRSFNNMKFA